MIGPGLQRVCRSVGRETILIPWLAADSPSSSRCSASRSSSRSPASRCCISLFGREPAVPSNATLVLRVGGDLAELAPADVVGYLRGVEDADRPLGRRQPAQGQGRPARHARCCSSRPASTRRSGARCRRSATRCSTSGSRASRSTRTSSTAATASTTSRRAADKVFLMPSTPLDLTGVATYELFLRGTLDKIGAYPGPAPHRRLQDRRRTRSPRRATRRRTRRWTSRSTAISTSSSCAASPTAGRRTRPTSATLIDEGPFLPRTRSAPGLVDDVAYEDQVDDKLRAGEQRRQLDGDDYARVSADVARPEPRPAHRGDLRGRHDHQRQERLRPGQRRRSSAPTRSSSTSARRGATARCARSCCASTAPADRRRRPTRSGAS